MAKKFIDIMDTSFRDGFQSVFGGRVLMNDFFLLLRLQKLLVLHTLSLVVELDFSLCTST